MIYTGPSVGSLPAATPETTRGPFPQAGRVDVPFDHWFALRSLVGAVETHLDDLDDEDAIVALDFALEAVMRGWPA